MPALSRVEIPQGSDAAIAIREVGGVAMLLRARPRAEVKCDGRPNAA